MGTRMNDCKKELQRALNILNALDIKIDAVTKLHLLAQNKETDRLKSAA